ncbi:hypothetical protein [Streptomyces sp. NPDC057302]|uniref:hypothetical protein n=1 Tax=Streptomyces sp. NPDC057302 TaxID=3346094 RepID=UPI00362EA3A7
MKILLWLALAIALVVNISSSFIIEDSTRQALVSVSTGAIALASGITLFMKRERNRNRNRNPNPSS